MVEEEAPKEAADANSVRPLSEQELGAAFGGPAVYSNRFFVTLSPGGVRIAFTEQHPGVDAQFRGATITSYQDAIQLMELLQKLLGPVQAQIAEVQTVPSNG